MDARTDSFLAARTRSQLTERPAWSPARDLLPREVVYIMNEILRLEVSFDSVRESSQLNYILLDPTGNLS